MLHREREIATNLIRSALAKGLEISVHDGIYGEGECVITRSKDLETILNALDTTEGDTIYLMHPSKRECLGVIYLIWGNDNDLIHDHSEHLEIDEDGCILSSNPNYDPFGKYIGTPRHENGWTA